MTSGILTLGQVRDVCLQIRAWREAGELEKAAHWLRRLRGERHLCSVSGCLSEPIPDKPWCRDHRMVRLEKPAVSDRRRDVLHLLRLSPPLTDGEVARRAGISAQRVREIRRQEGIPTRQWRRWGYTDERELPRRRQWR